MLVGLAVLAVITVGVIAVLLIGRAVGSWQ